MLPGDFTMSEGHGHPLVFINTRSLLALTLLFMHELTPTNTNWQFCPHDDWDFSSSG
jgi:hypothetical protein